jgi:hypothetical protein
MQSASKEKARKSLELNEKYISSADRLLTAKDDPQASEKYWSAATEITKAYRYEPEGVEKYCKSVKTYIARISELMDSKT